MLNFVDFVTDAACSRSVLLKLHINRESLIKVLILNTAVIWDLFGSADELTSTVFC